MKMILEDIAKRIKGFCMCWGSGDSGLFSREEPLRLKNLLGVE